jgi:hypothetical protein
MKWIALSIVVSSLIISFHYVWINRIIIESNNLTSRNYITVINKWTGNHCLFFPSKLIRGKYSKFNKLYNACIVDEEGKITFP